MSQASRRTSGAVRRPNRFLEMRTDDFEPVLRILRLFVPEIANGTVRIKASARIPGYRTKFAVQSDDANVDCVGACVGSNGSRMKDVVDALSGERIDIVRWSDDPQVFIRNCLQPAEIKRVVIDSVQHRAIIFVSEDQQSLATGRRGKNQQLASTLSGYEIEIVPFDDSKNGR